MEASAQLVKASNWFLWIAGCTVINVVLAGMNWHIVIGLIAPEIASALLHHAHEPYTFTSVATIAAVTLVCSGTFLLLRYFAVRASIVAFVMGIFFYGIDTAICAFAQDWLATAVHVWALWAMVGGIKACLDLKKSPLPAAASASSTPVDGASGDSSGATVI